MVGSVSDEFVWTIILINMKRLVIIISIDPDTVSEKELRLFENLTKDMKEYLKYFLKIIYVKILNL
jgi:hypothetical protein